MTKEELTKLAGAATYFENSRFESLSQDPHFRKFVINNSEIVLSFLMKAYNLSSGVGESAADRSATFESVKISTLPPVAPIPKSEDPSTVHPISVVQGLSLDIIEREVIQIICNMTGYPADMVEPEIDLEADLGVDTVKKMEIMADLAERYRMQFRKDFNISHVSTVKSIAKLVHEDSLSK